MQNGEEPRVKAHERKNVPARSANIIKGRLKKYIRWLNRIVGVTPVNTTVVGDAPSNTLTQHNIFHEMRSGLLLCQIVQKLDPSKSSLCTVAITFLCRRKI